MHIPSSLKVKDPLKIYQKQQEDKEFERKAANSPKWAAVILALKEEIEEWMDRCPIERFRDQLVEKSLAGKKEIERFEREIEAEISNAVQFAEKCFFPEPEEALASLYAE